MAHRFQTVKDHVSAWDNEYKAKGAVWRGRPYALPDLHKGAKVLELGCGNGKNLVEMARRGWDVIGIDASPEAVRLSKEALAQMDISAEVQVADAAALPFGDNKFDAVFAFHIFDHALEKERRAMAVEALRALKNGGTLYFRGFSTGDMRFGAGGKEMEPHTLRRESGILYHYFEAPEMEALFCGAGFAMEEIKKESWQVRIGNGKAKREEIVGIFVKS